jgi:hypothetical protein
MINFQLIFKGILLLCAYRRGTTWGALTVCGENYCLFLPGFDSLKGMEEKVSHFINWTEIRPEQCTQIRSADIVDKDCVTCKGTILFVLVGIEEKAAGFKGVAGGMLHLN